MHKKVLAIFSPNENAYSETFIQAHKKLPFEIKFYHSGDIPSQLEKRYDLQGNTSRLEKLKKRILKKFSAEEYGLYYSLKREKVNCVLAEYGTTAAETLNVVKALRLPLIVHFHGHDISNQNVLSFYRKKYLDVFEYADTVIAVSKKMQEGLMEMGCPATKIFLTFYGPNPIFFSNQPKYVNQQFIYAGRFVQMKGPHLVILAFKKVAERFHNARLVMIGDGPQLSFCKDLAAALELSARIHFKGVQTPEYIKQVFEESIALVQHSITTETGDAEGTPVVIVEAQAAALPVVSTYHAGIPEVVINNETGFLVQEHDVARMADYMRMLIEQPAIVKQMGTNARQRIRRFFTIEKHLNGIADKIKEAMILN
ncbi:MAG TPA: glycosyltransferase [Parafilimonas sp.]|nr:glycosyltransferase [Parafilimonas sp.]